MLATWLYSPPPRPAPNCPCTFALRKSTRNGYQKILTVISSEQRIVGDFNSKIYYYFASLYLLTSLRSDLCFEKEK